MTGAPGRATGSPPVSDSPQGAIRNSERRCVMADSSSRTKRRGLVWPVILGAVPLLILTLGFVAGMGEGEEGSAPSGMGAPSGGVSEEMRELGQSLARREPGDPMAMGDADAPVVMIAYSDYLCPFCRTWVMQTQPEIVDRYVDSGKVRIEWREFPYMGQTSETLAIGARAAAEQDRFWQYHQRIYEEQEELEEAGSEVERRMTDLAAEAGADPERFAADLDRQELAESVQQDFDEGQQVGISGTPAFLVNGDPIMGAQPLSAFASSIDEALAESGG